MSRFKAQLEAYAKFLEAPELARMQELLETGQFGAQQTNGLITDAGRNDLLQGRRHFPKGSMSGGLISEPLIDTQGIAESRRNLLDFMDRNSAPRPGVPTVQGISRAMADNAQRMGISQADASILDDIASGRPSPTPPAAKPSVPVSQVIPDRRPLMTATQPAPAAPKPTATQTPTKVSTTPTVRPKVATAMRNPYSASGALATAPVELAGQSPGVIQYLQDIFTGGKQAAGQGLQSAGKGLKGANSAIGSGLAKNGLKLAGAGGILSVLSAASEFADDDPIARNAAQAAGNLAGGWGGVAGGATLGTMVLPGVGTVVGAGLGGLFGTAAGSNIAGGVYDFVTGQSDEDRLRDQMVKDANLKQKLALQQAATQRQVMVDNREAMMPFVKDGLAVKREDDFARGERDLRIQNDYNYANALNQAMLQAQNNNNIQELALTQYMMG